MKVLDVIQTTLKEEDKTRKEEFKYIDIDNFLIIQSNTHEFNLVALEFGCLVYEVPFKTIEDLIGNFDDKLKVEVIGNYEQIGRLLKC